MSGKVGVIVLAYDGLSTCQPLIDDLISDNGVSSDDIVVVHNPSARVSDPGSAPVRVLPNASNIGYSGGMNAGIRSALAKDDYDHLLLLTHEVRLQSGAVATLSQSLEEDRRCAAVGPVLVSTDDVPYSYGVVQTRGRRYEHKKSESDGRPLMALDGTAMLWRVEALTRIGLFDERFFMYCEDYDLSLRARREGWSLAVASAGRVVTVPGGSSRPQAHAFLKTRNGLATAKAEGMVPFGFFAARLAYRGIRDGWLYVSGSMTPNRRLETKGIVGGILAFVRGRWGAPPASVLVNSDISNS